MQGERSNENKIEREFKRQIHPLFESWCEQANLTEIESRILYLKEFDERSLNEQEQIEILQSEFGYFYEQRTYRRHWKKLKKKIFKILP